MKHIFPKTFSEVASFFFNLISRNKTYYKIIVLTIFICLLPFLLNTIGLDFGIKYNPNDLTALKTFGNDNETFKVLHRMEKGGFIHTVLETLCVLIALFTVVFAFIIYEVKNDVITIVIGTTLFCAGILDAFHILASDQLIWAPDLNDVTIFTWLISRMFNSLIIFFTSIIILTDNDFFDKMIARSIYQVTTFFVLITVFTMIIVFFNVNLLPTTQIQKGFIKRPLELIPLLIFVVNGLIILPVFYKRNPSVFSFALLVSMIPASATQVYILFSSARFDNYFNIARLMKALSYLIPFAGIAVDYIYTHRKERLTYTQLIKETEEKAAAQSLLTGVLDSSMDGIISLESIRDENNQIIDFKISLINDAVERLTGYKKSELLGEQFLIKNPGNQKHLFSKYVEVVESGKSFTIQYSFNKERKPTWFSLVIVKLKDGLAITFKDITSEKKSEEEILHYQKELEHKVEELNRSNTELEQFAYVASHDLQEPLRKIQAFGDRLATKYAESLKAEGVDYISRMKNAASRMQGLINDLLNFSRVKRTSNKFEIIVLSEVIDSVLNDLETSVSNLNASICLASLPEIEGDKRQLGQLFQNLLSNALKFHRKGISPVIKISSRGLERKELNEKYKIQSDVKHYEIQVSDNGIGFDNKYLDKIFTIFQRLHGRSEYEGTGIGLAICRKVVENHQGYITAHSTLGEGTTFYIVLPEKQFDGTFSE